jgi:hypothetical protein
MDASEARPSRQSYFWLISWKTSYYPNASLPESYSLMKFILYESVSLSLTNSDKTLILLDLYKCLNLLLLELKLMQNCRVESMN